MTDNAPSRRSRGPVDLLAAAKRVEAASKGHLTLSLQALDPISTSDFLDLIERQAEQGIPHPERVIITQAQADAWNAEAKLGGPTATLRYLWGVRIEIRP